MSRQERLKILAKDAVEAAREALGFGLGMNSLGADTKSTVARLAAALIIHEAEKPNEEPED